MKNPKKPAAFSHVWITSAVVLFLLASSPAGATNKALDRCGEAARLLDEVMGTPEQAIPRELLSKARCVGLIPGLKKAGLVFAAKYGKGILACRTGDQDAWSGPSMVRLEGGSFGLQVGASSTDVVLLVMNEIGAEKLAESKFTLGADAAVAGGPVGRSAQAHTDAQMHAKILSYSRSRGVFAGVSLEGATLRPDAEANEKIYGKKTAHKEILAGLVPAPESTRDLLHTLEKHSVPDPNATARDDQETDGAEAPPPAEDLKPAVIEITSVPPYAEVEIDGSFNGVTPRTKAMGPGVYTITLRKKGFNDWTQSAELDRGNTLKIHAKLSPVEPDPASQAASAPSYQTPARKRNTGISISGLQ